MEAISLTDIILRIGLSLVLGGIIGFERERDSQPAGLRTHMILVIGACLAMILSINLANAAGTDPTRLAAQVVSGIGFLGAGAILRSGFTVKGLTTATTIWTMAIVGLAVGAGYYVVSIVTTVVLMVVLSVLDVIEKRFVRINVIRNVVIEVTDAKGIIRDVRKTMARIADQVITFSVQKSVKGKSLRLEIVARFSKSEKIENMVEQISEIEGVKNFKIE
ncbi:MAG: MgtC/SapB family protein [Anaerolineaceae bacterium]|jgi:putative Mg2+ transporter-C (MgtC) family protein|nr:MgtC/SapB family protein [Anaerolineaceae bacterium]MDD4043798.1 MgtC/SapB family protein [Anaerolineaceae bacterium]MDD4578795.1 MgtC/SapB family protein [Anaerolineaceae bacterium]